MKKLMVYKILLFSLISIMMFSCDTTENVSIQNTDMSINGRSIEIYVIDSCEYIGRIHRSGSDLLTHKGNCKFCKEREIN